MKIKIKNPTNKSHIPQVGEVMESLNRLSLFTDDSGFDPLISNLTHINNQGRRDEMQQSSINNFFKQ